MRLPLVSASWVLVVVVVLVACSSTSGSSDDCSTTVDLSCTPAYEPTFDNLFQKTLKPSCALAGTSCHAAAGHQDGVIMEDADSAHRTLVEGGKVVPGKPMCSEMARRILSTDRSFMMPPGMALPPGESCAAIQWMARGATR
jgi:hypothetical protein